MDIHNIRKDIHVGTDNLIKISMVYDGQCATDIRAHLWISTDTHK